MTKIEASSKFLQSLITFLKQLFLFLAAKLVGSLGGFYDKPIMTWGSVNSNDLTDQTKYPSVTTIVGTSRSLGLALMRVMKQYGWKQFAMLYATNLDQQRCTFIRNDIQDVVTADPDSNISFQRAISNTTLDSLKSVLKMVATKARSKSCFLNLANFLGFL